MTNGEKIKEIFPNMRITVCESYVQVMGKNYEFNNAYPLEWWNAEYIEPTTKNNSADDCISRREVDRLAYRYLKEPTDNHVAFYEHFLDLPSVTPQQYQEEHEKLERIKEIMSHEWSCWTPNYIQRVLDGTEDRY